MSIPRNFTYEDLIRKIKNDEHFSFVRFGDGEIDCILNADDKKTNCDGVVYQKEIQEELKTCLKSELSQESKIIWGLQSLGDRLYPQFKELYPKPWTNSDIIHNQNANGGLHELFDALKDKNVLLIGGGHLWPLAKEQGWSHFIVPKRDAFDFLRKNSYSKFNGIQIYLYSCGLAAELEILRDTFVYTTHIDIGSAFDPYVGVNSRSYHRNLKLDKIYK